MPKLLSDVYNQIIAHAQGEAPNECCGLLSGTDGMITQAHPISNLPSDDPRIAALNLPKDCRVRYMMDPKDQFHAMKEMRQNGLTMMGIYHSHPQSAAYPSPTDIRLAFYSDLFYLIISLAGRDPEARAFFIVEGKIREETIQRTIKMDQQDKGVEPPPSEKNEKDSLEVIHEDSSLLSSEEEKKQKEKQKTPFELPESYLLAEAMREIFDEDRVTHVQGEAEPEAD